jgi:hypothetical protein
MTFWNTVAAVIWGLAIYSVIDFVGTEATHKILAKRRRKKFDKVMAELEQAFAEQDRQRAVKKVAVRKKAAPKKK